MSDSFRLNFIQYLTFFTIGIVGSFMGPVIPFIRDDLELSYALAGIIFPAQSIGGLTVLLLSGFLIHVLGKRKFITAGCLVMIAGLAACAFADDYLLFIAGNVLLGAGGSFLDVGISTLCLDAHPEGKGKALNRLHFFFGAGAVAGPLIAFLVETTGGGWRWVFVLSAIGPFLALLFLAITPMPPSPPAEREVRFAVYKRPLLWLSALALCFYCGMEWSVGVWFPSYWKETLLASVVPPAVSVSLFWLTFAIGRLIVSKFADRWGFRQFLLVSMILTLALVFAWFVFPSPAYALVIVILLGLVIAGQYPTIVALASRKFPASAGQVTSFLSVFAMAGSTFFPAGVGFWADVSGISSMVGAEAILALCMFAFALHMFKADRKQDKL